MPCAYREFYGMDCPFCGGQRSALLLLQGRFRESFLLFPALIPLAATLFFIGRKRVLRVMLWLDLVLIVGSWLIRLFLA